MYTSVRYCFFLRAKIWRNNACYANKTGCSHYEICDFMSLKLKLTLNQDCLSILVSILIWEHIVINYYLLWSTTLGPFLLIREMSKNMTNTISEAQELWQLPRALALSTPWRFFPKCLKLVNSIPVKYIFSVMQ